jgi:hypothetical protein
MTIATTFEDGGAWLFIPDVWDYQKVHGATTISAA